MKAYEIDNINAVKEFLFDVAYKCQKALNPEEDLRMLRDDSGLTIFNAIEGEYMDNIMMECFIYCICNKINIYALAYEMQAKALQIKAAA